jgi:protease stability complex PrcB-like protein
MITRLFALLIPIAALGCGAGRTIRVADEGDSTGSGPVSLAPAPASDSGTIASPEPAPTNGTPLEQPRSGEQGYAPYGNTGSNTGALEVRRIGQWTHTGIGEARRVVIRDANTWAEFWSELGAGQRPDVDFTQNVVVAVTAGQRPAGGYEIAVDRVSQINGELSIEVVERTPGPNCLTSSGVTQPADVVVVPGISPRSWSFVERQEVRGCR